MVLKSIIKTKSSIIHRTSLCHIAILFVISSQQFIFADFSITANSNSVIFPAIQRIIPHDRSAFTQGLLFLEGYIYESTGLNGKSSLRKVNPSNGIVEKHITVPGIFAEGLVFKDNIFVQLTWKKGIAIVYTYPELEKAGIFKYNGEGWGITTDGTSYIMSNGSDTLYWRNKNFKITKKICIKLNNKPLVNLNELEYARGKIYANVWFSDFIYVIDPLSGEVTQSIDCRILKKQAHLKNNEQVLNGIAYNKTTDLFYLTGKMWPVMFEVKLSR